MPDASIFKIWFDRRPFPSAVSELCSTLWSRSDMLQGTAIITHLHHGEGREKTRELLRRCYRTLRAKGRLLIAEVIPDDDRRGPLFPLLFAVNMLVLTEHGGTYTLSEYAGWLESAGFQDIRSLEAPAPSPLIFAVKP